MLTRERMDAADPARTHMQRVDGTGVLAVGRDGVVTGVRTLRQIGAAKIRFPMPAAGQFEATLINTAGGLTGGDRLRWELDATAGSALVASTPAAERAYRSTGDRACVDVQLQAGQDSRLYWMPQETILYEGSSLRRTITAEIAASARLLVAETLVFGRKAMGETIRSNRFDDSWRIRAGGMLVHAEEARIRGDATSILAGAGTGGGMSAFATILLVAEDAPSLVAPAREALGGADALHGVSAQHFGQTGKLLARIAASDGRCLRAAVRMLLPVLVGEAALPRIWAP